MNLKTLAFLLFSIQIILAQKHKLVFPFDYKIYTEADTTSPEIKPKSGTYHFIMIDSVNGHEHEYFLYDRYYSFEFSTTKHCFYAKVQTNLGEVGYIHSSQLMSYGEVIIPDKFKLEHIQLDSLPDIEPCKDIDHFNISCTNKNNHHVNVTLNNFWIFYDTDTLCKLYKRNLYLDCEMTIHYNMVRFCDYGYTGIWQHHLEIAKVEITKSKEYTLKESTPIYIEPRKKSKIALKKGEKVLLEEIYIDERGNTTGDWVKIKSAGKEIEGWVMYEMIDRN